MLALTVMEKEIVQASIFISHVCLLDRANEEADESMKNSLQGETVSLAQSESQPSVYQHSTALVSRTMYFTGA